MYCNAACKKKHRHKHKKGCEEHIRLANEYAAELHDIELFKRPPPGEDCPICFICLPTYCTGGRYMSCCGQIICTGCIHAPVYDDQGNEVVEIKCPYCRTPAPTTSEEAVERGKKRVEAGDALAIRKLGVYYRLGVYGFPQDYTKALELWQQAAELGCAGSYWDIGYLYENGLGVERDKKKAVHYFELAAMEGDVNARGCLGVYEARAGKMDRALRHFMISIRGGDNKSLEKIKGLYSNGYATKEDYTKALQLYQEYLGEIKSAQRDKAAAAYEDCRYY